MKTCGKCKWFSYINGDMDAREYPDGGDWGYCHAPIPQHIEDTLSGEVLVNDPAKDCETYKKKKL